MRLQKENNLQKMLGTNINLRGKLYERNLAAKAGQGLIRSSRFYLVREKTNNR